MCDAQSAGGQHCGGSGMSEFVSLGKFYSLPEERAQPVMNDERIWFFGQKFIDYCHYNFGQYVTFAGAHYTYFDVMSEEWNKSELDESAFESLVDTASTKFSEALFSFNSQIFLLLYAGFGAITAPNEMLLFAFSEEDRAWRKVAVVNRENMPTSDNKEKSDDSEERRRQLIQVEGNTNDGLYFLDDDFNIYQLRIQSDSAATFYWIAVISRPVRPDLSKPATSTLIDGKIFIQYGRHGCGFHYEPLNLIVYDLLEKSARHVEIKDDKYPHFRFTGASSHAGGVPTANSWSHFCGLTSVGMTGTQFNGQLWSLDNVDSDAPEWRNILPGLEVPDPKDHNYHVVFDKARRDVYMFSKVLGVLKISIGN